MNKVLIFLSITLFFTSCSVDDEAIVNYPKISINNPNQEIYNIGQNIPIDILITHNEAIDNITYYESCNCTNSNFNSLNLIDLQDVYENEWTYIKNISTKNIPENIMCDYNIEISAEDLNSNKSTKSIYFHVMTITEDL